MKNPVDSLLPGFSYSWVRAIGHKQSFFSASQCCNKFLINWTQCMVTTKWRPPKHIKVKALGLHWREGKLLAAEVYDDQGKLQGVRPIGGSIEFGEQWQSALIREFKEELNVDIETKGSPVIIENIYSHEGELGHEVLFICEVLFASSMFKGQSFIEFHEDSGTSCIARWFDLNALDLPGGPALFPAGLKAALNDKFHSTPND